MRIALLGANGQLGSDIFLELKSTAETVPLTHADVRIEQEAEVSRVLKKIGPDVVINTAALSNVPRCESEPAEAFRANALGARNVAVACEKIGAELVHISTDYVFDGRKGSPYVEDDLPGPLNIYGLTKLSGEYLVRAFLPRHYILRTSGIYGVHKCRSKGHNFVENIVAIVKEKGSVTVVNDEVLTPTHCLNVARQIMPILKKRAYGTYHVTDEGQCSWFEFATAIIEMTGIEARLEAASVAQRPSPVKRPRFSVLENRKLKELGINVMKPWRDALREYLGLKGWLK